MTKDENNRITRMEEDIKTIKERLDLMPTIEGMELSNEKLVKKVIDEANKRYASKTTETIVYGAAWLVLSSVIVYALKCILF